MVNNTEGKVLKIREMSQSFKQCPGTIYHIFKLFLNFFLKPNKLIKINFKNNFKIKFLFRFGKIENFTLKVLKVVLKIVNEIFF